MARARKPAKLDKTALKIELLHKLKSDLATLERAHLETSEGLTHEDAKPESDKDTRAIEQSYLARGQAARIEDLRAAVTELEAMPIRTFAEDQPAALTALITVEEEDETRRFFLAPHGGGTTLASGEVQVVTPKSPLGRGLLGKRAGDSSEVSIAGKTRDLEIVRVE